MSHCQNNGFIGHLWRECAVDGAYCLTLAG